jgi:hypothetical protein
MEPVFIVAAIGVAILAVYVHFYGDKVSTLALKMDLHYWGAASRAHYPMFVAGAAKKLGSVNCVTQIPYPGAPGWAEYPSKSYLGQLPYLVDGSTKIGESMAIVRYFARKFGCYNGKSDADFGASEQMIQWSDAMHDTLSTAQYAPNRTGEWEQLSY